MRKIVIAKALVLTIFGIYVAVAMVEPPNAKSDHVHNVTSTASVVPTCLKTSVSREALNSTL
jgi:flagellar motor component MotA